MEEKRELYALRKERDFEGLENSFPSMREKSESLLQQLLMEHLLTGNMVY